MTLFTIRRVWNAAIEGFYNEQLKERYLAEVQPPAARWEQIRDRLVFVHDRLSPQQLEALCEEEFDEEEEDEERAVGRSKRHNPITRSGVSQGYTFTVWREVSFAGGQERL